MPTATETTKVLQDKFLSGIQASQNAFIDSVKSWASVAETTFAKLPELAFAETPLKPSQFLESSFEFGEKFVTLQRDFASRVFEAALPAARAATTAAKTATKG